MTGFRWLAPPDRRLKEKAMSNELQTSKLAWTKLRRVLLTAVMLGGLGAGTWYLVSGDAVMLSADAIVTRQRVAVAAPWQDARVREVYVRPGDRVEAGQKIAIVESPTMSRSLAELAAEKARIGSRVAQLEGRKTVVTTLLPLAEASAAEAQAFLGKVQNAGANGLAVSKTLAELTAARVQASERFLSLKAEQGSLELETKATKAALDEVSAAYDDLQRTYEKGVLHAPVSGYVGANVAMVGEVTEALPPEFQLPNRVRGRGQLVRIALPGKAEFAMDQKAHVTGCLFESCRTGLSGAAMAATPALQRFADKASRMIGGLKDLAVAVSRDAIATPAAAATAN